MIAILQTVVAVTGVAAFLGLVCTIAGCVQSLRGNVGQMEKSL